MAKPNVWRADIHLTDRIIARLAFSQLIIGTQDSLCVFLRLWPCLSCYFTTQGDFEGLGEVRISMLITCHPAQLVDQLTCPFSPLVSTESHMPASSHTWLSKANSVCSLPTSELIFHIYHFPAPFFRPNVNKRDNNLTPTFPVNC